MLPSSSSSPKALGLAFVLVLAASAATALTLPEHPVSQPPKFVGAPVARSPDELNSLEGDSIKTEFHLEKDQVDQGNETLATKENLEASLPALPPALPPPPPKPHRFGAAPAMVDNEIQSIKNQPMIVSLRCNATAAELSWRLDSQQPVDYYLVYRWNNTDKILEPVPFTPNITGTSVTIHGLYPSKVYKFQVQAFAGDKATQLSSTADCTTNEGKPVRNPQLLSAYRDEKNGSMVIRWTMVEPKYHGAAGFRYRISLRKGRNNPQPAIFINNWRQTERRVQTDGDSLYYIRIVSENNYGECDSAECRQNFDRYSDGVVGNIEEQPPTIAPRNIKVEPLDGETANLTWTPISIEELRGNFKSKFFDLWVSQVFQTLDCAIRRFLGSLSEFHRKCRLLQSVCNPLCVCRCGTSLNFRCGYLVNWIDKQANT